MAEITIGGRIMDLLTRGELKDELRVAHEQAQASVREQLKGVKPVRFLISGVAASSALTMGGSSGETVIGPESGFVWNLRHLIIEGMTAGATPDVMNIRRSGGDRIMWQLNGNQFCQTFSRGEFVLYSGENLRFESVGTFAATGPVIAHGLADNVPGEMIGKFF